MSARIDTESASLALGGAIVQPGALEALAPLAIDPDDRYGGPSLPSDHPAWMRDAVSLSARARALLGRLKPVVVRVVGVWEHRIRSVVIAGRTVVVDASGSYRLP